MTPPPEAARTWQDSRWVAHISEVLFLSTFLALIAIPLYAMELLKKRFPDDGIMWNALSFIDETGTVIIFSLFWYAIILRIWAETRPVKTIQVETQQKGVAS